MNIELVPPEAPEWRAFLHNAEHDFYHLPAYVALCAREEGGEPCALYVQNADRRLLLPLILRPLTDDYRDATSPYGYPGPLIAGKNDAFLTDVLAAAPTTLARRRIVSLFVRGHPLLGPRLDSPLGTVIEHGLTVSIDLTRSLEELWRQTMRGHRTEIRRAIRSTHRAFFDDKFEHLGTFAQIYRANMQRVNADRAYMFSDRYFTDLADALGDRLFLCLVEIGGEISGGGLFVETCGLLQYHLSATLPCFSREHPTKLMLHFVRTWAKTRGLRRVHLGGGIGARADSLFKFKAGFSPDRHRFCTLRLVCDEPAYTRLVRTTHPSADPSDLSGYFPKYREAHGPHGSPLPSSSAGDVSAPARLSQDLQARL
jgi:hypothetical protein